LDRLIDLYAAHGWDEVEFEIFYDQCGKVHERSCIDCALDPLESVQRVEDLRGCFF
jgi:hypothetical protein